MPSDRGNSSIHVISFLLWSIYDCLFSFFHVCLRVMKIADLGQKIMQILKMAVNLLSEHFLAINLQHLFINCSMCMKMDNRSSSRS